MLHKLKKPNGESGVFTDELIPKGSLIFSSVDWVSDEQSGWHLLSVEDVHHLAPDDKERFLRYSYDKNFDSIIGTFDWENAKHLSNFINHSCGPNAVYDVNDNIIAYRDILQSEEITIDYGTFIVNLDQNFLCHCGAPDCRQYVKKDDWQSLLYKYHYSFPVFMHPKIRSMLVTSHSAKRV